MNSIESNICDAIEVLIDKAISNARFDRTISATIVRCEDPSIGKYLVRYQDSTFYAYTNSADVTYPKNAVVYILVPENDMSKEKSIIGTASKTPSEVIDILEEEYEYALIGTNCVNPVEGLKLSTYHNQVNNIYSATKTDNIVVLDEYAIENYIKNSSSIVCGATFRTEMAPEQQIAGNYGIIFTLKVKDDDDKEVEKKYIVDINRMIGNPYRLNTDTKQTHLFGIDGSKFIRVESIDLFCEGFPNQRGENEDTIPDSDWDIFIKDIEFCGASRLTEEELNGKVLILETPDGTIFTERDLDDSATKEIIAQIRVKGLPIDVETRMIPFYWFIKDPQVTPSDPDYNKYGGTGWKWLNKKDEETGEWDFGPIYSITKNSATAYETRVKCVAIYENEPISKEISIINLNTAARAVLLQSDSGTEFYYGNGNPILTCTVLEKDNETGNLIDSSSQFTYKWSVQKTNVEGQVVNEDIPSESPSENDPYIDEEKENVLHVKVIDIIDFSIYRCSVFDKTANKNYCGSAEITLYNKLESKGMYSLIINNGSQVFTYDEAGVSPASESLENPITIPELSFTLYDNEGNKIEEEKLEKIVWEFPITDTLLVAPERTPNDLENPATGMISFNDRMTLSYSITDQYSYDKFNNQISLTVTYKDLNIVARTNFTFNKQGDPGTNGTRYTCRIVPKGSSNTPYYLTVTNRRLNYGNYYFANKDTKLQPFEVELWDNGQRIFRSDRTTNIGNADSPEWITVKWEILKNKYAKDVSDESNFSVHSEVSDGVTVYSFSYDTGYMGTTEAPANLLKATIVYRGQTYYAVEPLVTVELAKTEYKVDILDYTGFKHVLYSSAGQLPNYARRPFVIRITKNGGDISSQVGFGWRARGNYKIKADNKVLIKEELKLELSSETILASKPRETSFKPADSYNGLTVTNAISINLWAGSDTEDFIGYVNIPVHFLLNKYGLANINEWDGNSIQLNEDGGYILTPQVGAGSKNDSNQFTGVIMGEVKEANRTTSDIGLLGYHNGDRTIFLDSETGAAIFGSGNGQMAIDPSVGKALLYSRNYWTWYQENGLPSSYDDTLWKSDGTGGNGNGQGMLIDLTTPAIKFGSGNFFVNAEGSMIAKLGSIAGWSISPGAITSENGSTVLNSNGNIQLGQLGTRGTIELAGFTIYSGENDDVSAGVEYNPTKSENPVLVSNKITSLPPQKYEGEDTTEPVPGGKEEEQKYKGIIPMETLVLSISDGNFVTLTGQELQFRSQNPQNFQDSRGLSIFAGKTADETTRATVLQPYDAAISPAIGYLSNWNLVNIPTIRAGTIFQLDGDYYQKVATEQWVSTKLNAAVQELQKAINTINATYENHSHNIDFSTNGNGTVTATMSAGGAWGASSGRFNQAGTKFFKNKQFKEFVSEGKGNPNGVGIGNFNQMILVYPGPEEFAGGKSNVLYNIDMKNANEEVMHTFQIQVTDTMSTDHLKPNGTLNISIEEKKIVHILKGFSWVYLPDHVSGSVSLKEVNRGKIDLGTISIDIDVTDVYNRGKEDWRTDSFSAKTPGATVENKTKVIIGSGLAWSYQKNENTNSVTVKGAVYLSQQNSKLADLHNNVYLDIDATSVYNQGISAGIATGQSNTRTDFFTASADDAIVEITNKKTINIKWKDPNAIRITPQIQEHNSDGDLIGAFGISIDAEGVFKAGWPYQYTSTASNVDITGVKADTIINITGGYDSNALKDVLVNIYNNANPATQVNIGSFNVHVDASDVKTDHYTLDGTPGVGISNFDGKINLSIGPTIDWDKGTEKTISIYPKNSKNQSVGKEISIKVDAQKVFNNGWNNALPYQYTTRTAGVNIEGISTNTIINISSGYEYGSTVKKEVWVSVLNNTSPQTAVGSFQIKVDAREAFDKGYLGAYPNSFSFNDLAPFGATIEGSVIRLLSGYNQNYIKTVGINILNADGKPIKAFTIQAKADEVYDKGKVDWQTDHFELNNPSLGGVAISKKLISILDNFSWTEYNGTYSGSLILKEVNARSTYLGTNVGLTISATPVYNKGKEDGITAGKTTHFTSNTPGVVPSTNSLVVNVNSNFAWAYPETGGASGIIYLQQKNSNNVSAGNNVTINIDATKVYDAGVNSVDTDSYYTNGRNSVKISSVEWRQNKNGTIVWATIGLSNGKSKTYQYDIY